MDDIQAIGKRKLFKDSDWYSPGAEADRGRREAEEFERDAQLIADPAVNQYIGNLGNLLARNSDAPQRFTVKVVNSDEVNCFALPGGFVYVTAGLIEAAENESELAGVMAQAVAHVAARHATRMQTRMNIANMLSVPFIWLPGDKNSGVIFTGGQDSYAARAGLAAPLSFLKYSQTYTLEADYLGIQYMYAAGYEPQSFVSFLEKLEVLEGNRTVRMSQSLATHPRTALRIQDAKKEIARILPPRSNSVVNTPAFVACKGRVKAMPRPKALDTVNGPNTLPSLLRNE